MIAHSELELTNKTYLLFFEFAPILLSETPFEKNYLQAAALKNIKVEFSGKLGRSLGICYPERRRIALNEKYFLKKPSYIGYTLFHEMVHQYLFDIQKPWHHTKEFYRLMEKFPRKYPVDPNVHVHKIGKRTRMEIDANVADDSAIQEFQKYLKNLFTVSR